MASKISATKTVKTFPQTAHGANRVKSMKYSNSDVVLDEIISKNGGRFIVSNLDILDAKW
jgi:hypothetical protein